MLGDYKAKDNELIEREKFMQGIIEKVIGDARNTKQLLMSQINYLQKQLHAPKKNPPLWGEAGDEVKSEDGNFTEAEPTENEPTETEKEGN